MLDEIAAAAAGMGMTASIYGADQEISRTLQDFSLKPPKSGKDLEGRKMSFLERIGQWLDKRDREILEFIYLLADTFYYGFVKVLDPRGRRKGEFTNQSLLIGMNALPIVGLVSFLIGFILALQSAAQLRQFGADIYVADLIA
ncbi:MAG TPA: ABC transporter, partial [bacterium]|nr:ABC transporter [bacterium]